jgi:hypothetical protein
MKDIVLGIKLIMVNRRYILILKIFIIYQFQLNEILLVIYRNSAVNIYRFSLIEILNYFGNMQTKAVVSFK